MLSQTQVSVVDCVMLLHTKQKILWFSVYIMQELWDTGNSCLGFGTFHAVSSKLIGQFSSFPLLFKVLALGSVKEKEVGCLRLYVISSTSWNFLVEQHAHFCLFYYKYDLWFHQAIFSLQCMWKLVWPRAVLTHSTKETLMFT